MSKRLPAECSLCGRRFANFRRAWADFCSRVCHPDQADQVRRYAQRRGREREPSVRGRHMRPDLPDLT